MRGVIPVDVLRNRHISIGSHSRVEKLSNDVYLEVGQCLMNLKGNEEKLTAFLDNIRSWKSVVLSDVPKKLDFTNKYDVLQSLVGVPLPEKIDILPPQGIHNKGCGTSKRLIGAGERAITKSKRPKRPCRGCKELVNHDIRNCPVRKATSN
ncbi:uncharacterized protein LOC112509085 [Cynara cardunculus var. scolymus]|uniref:uncharacterized protein LOC112509085 n=1 Tax=Cynara cardunculus var. scolymus TaxID=59895 RepID=UPI000D624D43|nr:uncharacterized protein LOC112509085 [Cynara cardunculus var. scolymus]